MQSNRLTVGFTREDGDFEVVATFNNSKKFLSDVHFQKFVNEFIDSFDGCSNTHALEVLVRADAPDTIFYLDMFEEV